MEKVSTLNRKPARMTYDQMGELNGMLPPQAVELEKSVLGALMLDQEALFGYIDKIHEGMFYKAEHQTIFAAIRSLVNSNHDVDLLTVTEQLMREGKLELAGGAFYLSQLTNNVVSAAHMDYHIIILTEKYIQREVIRTSTENIREAYDASCDALELIDRAQVKLMEVSELSFRSDGTSLGNLMNDTEKVLFSEKSDEYSIPSGFIELDRITSGFQPGTLIILAARPAMGKTACGLTMARNIAVDFNKPVAFFSMEMTGVELTMRLISSEAEIPSHRLKNASSLYESEKDTLVRKMQQLRNAPIYIDDTAGLDIFQLRAKCRKMKQKYGIKMVFIDYLQLMTSSGDANRNRNREQELGAISRQLKEMSKELNVPVLAMAQFNRKVDDRPMGIPQLSDLRESGAIEQDADIVIAIHRLWKYGIEQDEHGDSTENQATLRILKHRSGELGVVKLRFEGKYVRFSNPPLFTVDSKINTDIKPNGSFDNPTDAAREKRIQTSF
ncbi:MAG: replicative DNA helicase [Bacteroidales bacterium]|nr:replicative DNA helicase [Bacteroidales bacterium]